MMEMLTNTQVWLHAAGVGHEDVVLENGFKLKTCVLCSGMRAAVCCISPSNYTHGAFERAPNPIKNVGWLLCGFETGPYLSEKCARLDNS